MSRVAPTTRAFLEAFTTNGPIGNMIVEDCALSYPAVTPLSRVAKSPKTFRRNTHQRREIREVFE
jgi:hypothetical protein